MEKLREYAAVCTIGSVGYSAIEVLWRGFTHWTMALAGGVGFLLLYLADLRMAGRSCQQALRVARVGLFPAERKPAGTDLSILLSALVFALYPGDAIQRPCAGAAVSAACRPPDCRLRFV